VHSHFVKLTLGLPFFTLTASLLFHTLNNPMGLLVAVVSFHILPVSPVILSGMLTHALFTPITQAVFVAESFAKLNLVFQLFAFGALLH
jgi:hypothetical protein